jgi:hypothetical protein
MLIQRVKSHSSTTCCLCCGGDQPTFEILLIYLGREQKWNTSFATYLPIDAQQGDPIK